MRDERALFPGGQQGGLVEQVLQISAGEARGGLGHGPCRSTSSARGLFRAWTRRISSRPLMSGRPT